MNVKKSFLVLLCAGILVILTAIPANAASIVIKTKPMYTTQDVNARVGPSTKAPIAKVVPKNTRIQVIAGTSSTWYSVWMDAKIIYIYGEYVSENKLPAILKIGYVSQNINNETLAVRSKANAKSAKIGTLKKGERVNLTKAYTKNAKDAYYQVVYKNKVGYVLAKGVVFEENSTQQTTFGIVANNGTVPLKIRKQPSTSSEILGTLKEGEIVTFSQPYTKGTKASWYKINYKGKTAYVSAQYIKLLFSE